MARTQDAVYCDGCGVEITWSPIQKGNEIYCCIDCRDGMECSCGDRLELDDERRDSAYSDMEPG